MGLWICEETAESRRADDALREFDQQRWADDGGFIPAPTTAESKVRTRTRNPWAIVGVAIGFGFAFGWITSRR